MNAPTSGPWILPDVPYKQALSRITAVETWQGFSGIQTLPGTPERVRLSGNPWTEWFSKNADLLRAAGSGQSG